jgi:hypothetical protein
MPGLKTGAAQSTGLSGVQAGGIYHKHQHCQCSQIRQVQSHSAAPWLPAGNASHVIVGYICMIGHVKGCVQEGHSTAAAQHIAELCWQSTVRMPYVSG